VILGPNVKSKKLKILIFTISKSAVGCSQVSDEKYEAKEQC
jgi:hypothetical protein